VSGPEKTPGPDPSDEDIEFLKAVRMRPEPFATATDLAPDMQVGRRQTRNRLDQLVEQGFLNVETVGRTNVYWLTDEGKEQLRQTRS